eukprot:12171-Chlamydomonas_euryale.AAC.1
MLGYAVGPEAIAAQPANFTPTPEALRRFQDADRAAGKAEAAAAAAMQAAEQSVKEEMQAATVVKVRFAMRVLREVSSRRCA